MRSAAAWSVALLLVGSGLAKPIPPAPTSDHFVYDYARLLDEPTESLVQDLAYESYRQSNAPIVVVTISSMRDYDSSSIEGLATRWFNEWRIGTLGLEAGSNQGILLLIAVRDRKARIELGATWGRRWDRRCERIMSGVIVPAFKAGDYPGGVRGGVQALHEMAQQGPDSHPPGDFLADARDSVCRYSWFPPNVALMVMGTGLLLVLAGIFRGGDSSFYLIALGVLLILIGALTYFVMIVMLILSGPSRRGGSGGYSGGGGFSGGFSGGGGASVSW